MKVKVRVKVRVEVKVKVKVRVKVKVNIKVKVKVKVRVKVKEKVIMDINERQFTSTNTAYRHFKVQFRMYMFMLGNYTFVGLAIRPGKNLFLI